MDSLNLERPPRGGAQDLFYSKANTRGLPTIVRGEGIYIFDDRGNRFIDVISGAMAASLGQGNERVLKAMYEQGMKHTFSYVRVSRHLPNAALTERVSRLAGAGFERVHLSSGGSESVEMAIKFLRQYSYAKGNKDKTRIITLMPSYHGGTLATIGWTGDEDAASVWGPMAVFGEKIPAPLSYRPPFGTTSEDGSRGAAAALEAKIIELGAENVLAFMMEPIGGQSTGANVPHPIFFSEVRRVCDKYGVFLVFDEIVSACRSGKFLAAHHYPDCKPDVVITAKGLGATYTPIGAMMASAEMVDELADLTGFNLSHTYNANPITCAGAAAVLDEMVDRDLIGNAAMLGEKLKARLEGIKDNSPIVGDVRGQGLMLAVEYVRDKMSKEVFSGDIYASDRIRQIGVENGLMLYSRRQNGGRYGEWSVVCPPLIITEDQIDDLANRLERTIAAFVDEMVRAKVL
ncbi:MAG: aspartate aminotransferase family protein [Mesorhizobium sp.]|uniref:aminotransferase family protein n=1 Tax=Mesorhizobium sp. TaxID=1871066 RepID=UPI0011FC099D|nr:aminotransferase class III-fold pyridoxal phosphate-dependent enzyme [Mesorhizobium sp.]TIP30739.1 MAG: aspartate aminotransferase family protein [Mesorhizobium sp.]